MSTGNERKFEYPPNFMDDKLPKGVLSPSQFDMYRRCPRQYMHRYIEDRIQPPAVAMIKGTAVHHGAEVTHRHTIENGEPLKLEEAEQEVADVYDKESENVEDWEGEDKDKEKDATLRNFRIYYLQAVPVIKPVKVEYTFAQFIGTVPTRGVIDLVDSVVNDEPTVMDDPDKPLPMVEVVSDLKVTGRTWPDQKVRHAPQLTFYSIVEDTERVRVDLLLDQKSGTKYSPIKSFRTNTDKRILIEDVEEVTYLIKLGQFPRCDPTHWVCTPRFCGYYEKCRGPK